MAPASGPIRLFGKENVMVKMRVLKASGISGKKREVGEEVDVKSSLAPGLAKDGRAEFVDAAPPAKVRAGARGGARRRGAA